MLQVEISCNVIHFVFVTVNFHIDIYKYSNTNVQHYFLFKAMNSTSLKMFVVTKREFKKTSATSMYYIQEVIESQGSIQA